MARKAIKSWSISYVVSEIVESILLCPTFFSYSSSVHLLLSNPFCILLVVHRFSFLDNEILYRWRGLNDTTTPDTTTPRGQPGYYNPEALVNTTTPDITTPDTTTLYTTTPDTTTL